MGSESEDVDEPSSTPTSQRADRLETKVIGFGAGMLHRDQ